LTDQGRCPAHRKQADQWRGSRHARGYTNTWAKASAQYLRSHPLCVRCLDAGLTTASQVTDHIIPHKGDDELFWNEDNWQALCKPCHDHKTAVEDGGFGRAI